MPLYEYFCQKCDAKFEQVAEIQDRFAIECPDCGNKAKLQMSKSNSKIYSPFTKDGEGFSSVTYSKPEFRERVKHNLAKYDKL